MILSKEIWFFRGYSFGMVVSIIAMINNREISFKLETVNKKRESKIQLKNFILFLNIHIQRCRSLHGSNPLWL